MLAQTVPFAEIIVVDNASPDQSADLVERLFERLRLIRLPWNTGFCHANNVGLRQTRGDFVLFANPDTVMEPDYLEKALGGFEPGDRIGMVSGKLLRFDRRTIDSAGQILTIGRRIQDRGYGQPDTGQYDQPAEIDSVCGAMALYRRSMIDEISAGGELFDEDFFSFWEDMDVGWRARRSGWKAVYVPAAVAYHFRGGSQDAHGLWSNFIRMSGRSPEIRYHIVKNQWLMVIKNESICGFLCAFPFLLTRNSIILLYIILTCPSVLWMLLTRTGFFRRALRKRGDILKA